jgi:hypothetical protein
MIMGWLVLRWWLLSLMLGKFVKWLGWWLVFWEQLLFFVK